MYKVFRSTTRPASILFLGLMLAAPVTAVSEPWRFIAVGDTRGDNTAVNPTILPEIANEIVRHDPKFVIVPGDLVNSGSARNFQTWKAFMEPVYNAGIGVYPIIGNHDANAVAEFKEAFGPDIPDNGPPGEIDRTYAIEHNNVLVLALDTYVRPSRFRSRRLNQAWIDQVLSANTRPHVFAFGHMPAFKASHTECLDDYPAARDEFWRSLRNAGAKVYFAGHDHFYNHARIDDGDLVTDNDVHQIIVGGGGAPFHPSYAYDGANTIWSPQNVHHDQQYGYVLVEVDGNTVTLDYYRRVGVGTYAATSDSWVYTVDPRPAAPTDLSSIAGDASVTLRWAPATGASTYNVKRSISKGGPYSVISSGITETAFTDYSVVNGTTYYYIVTRVNASVESAASGVATAMPQPRPPAPSAFVTIEEPGAVKLKWTSSAGATGYNVKRSTAAGGPYVNIASGITALTHVDTDVVGGVTYYYVISAVNAVGEGFDSIQGSAKLPAAVPGQFMLAAKALRPRGIMLTWTGVSGAASYTVKRAGVRGGPYTQLASGLTRPYFIDTAPAPGTYYYVVTAITASGMTASNQAQATATARTSRWRVWHYLERR